MARKSVTLVNVGPGTNKSPMPLKNPVIVVGEKRGGIEAGGPGALERGVVDKGAGRVVGPAPAAIGAVGIGRQRGNAWAPSRWYGERQGIFLVRAAAAAAAQRHRKLAAGQDRDAAALCGIVAGQPRMLGRDLARLALQPVAQHHAVVAGLPRRGPAPPRRASAGRATIR